MLQGLLLISHGQILSLGNMHETSRKIHFILSGLFLPSHVITQGYCFTWLNSMTHTHITRLGSFGRGIGPLQRPATTHNDPKRQKKISDRIRISLRAVADLRLRLTGESTFDIKWNTRYSCLYVYARSNYENQLLCLISTLRLLHILAEDYISESDAKV
jgi:hypothetical protein